MSINLSILKKISLSISTCFVSLSAFAQIPNAGFETWTSHGAYSTPNGWGTMNNTTAAGGVYTVTKGTPGNPGSWYLKLTSKTVTSGVVNGIAVSGVLDSITMLPKSGFAYSAQPANFTGSWQHMIAGSSQGAVTATLTKWNTSTHARDAVATATQTLSGMAMSWATFSIPFVYVSGNTPDSCIIVLKASGAAPTNGDYLWVDNLAFSGTVTGIEDREHIFAGFDVYPNPSSENISVDFNLAKTENVKLQMIDLNGRLVKEAELGSVTGAVKYSLNVNEIAKGTYFISIIAAEGIEVKKIIVK